MRFVVKDYIIDFFNKGHERSIAAKRNIAASFFIKGTSVIINIALVPLTINYVNPTQYGIWLTLSSIISWFTFFDVGFGNGLRNRYTETKAKGNFVQARIYISTTYVVLGIIFLSLWAIFFMGNFFINWSKILNTPSEMAVELSKLAIIVFSFFCMQMVFKTINTIIIADQKPAFAAFLDMLGQLLALIVIFILTKTTEGSLVKLGLSLGLVPIIVMVASSFLLFRNKYRDVSPNVKHVHFSYARDIMNLGVKFFVIQASAIIIFQTTNLVISQILGPESVTVYNIAHKYFFSAGTLFLLILSPFWSAFTDAYTLGDFNWIKSIIRKLEWIWLLLIPLISILLILSNFVYKIWIGDSVKIPFTVSVVMAAYVIFFTRFNMYILLINGIGKVTVQLIVNITICLVFIPLAIYSSKHWGLTGLILLSVVVSIIHAIIGQLQLNRLSGNTAIGLWNK